MFPIGTIDMTPPPTPPQQPSLATTKATQPPDESLSDSFPDAKILYNPSDARHPSLLPAPPSKPVPLTAQALATHQDAHPQGTLAFNNPQTGSRVDSLCIPQLYLDLYRNELPSGVRTWGEIKGHHLYQLHQGLYVEYEDFFRDFEALSRSPIFKLPSQPVPLTAQNLVTHQDKHHQMMQAFNNPQTRSMMDSLDMPQFILDNYRHLVPSETRKWGEFRAHLRAYGIQLGQKAAYMQWTQALDFQAQNRAQVVERRQQLSQPLPSDRNDVRDGGGYWTKDEFGRERFTAWPRMWGRQSTASDHVEERPAGAFVVDEEAQREWELLCGGPEEAAGAEMAG